MKRSLLSVGVAMATLGLPVLGAVSAAGTAAAPAADPSPAVELVTAPLVEVYSYGGRVYDPLGARLAATDEAVELWSTRASYAEPIRTEWRSSAGTTVLPLGTMKQWYALPWFSRMILKDAAGNVVYDRTSGMCLNGDSQRMRPDAPARSPYPWGCPWNPFTKGSVQGIQAGWSVPLSQPGNGVKVPRGALPGDRQHHAALRQAVRADHRAGAHDVHAAGPQGQPGELPEGRSPHGTAGPPGCLRADRCFRWHRRRTEARPAGAAGVRHVDRAQRPPPALLRDRVERR